MSLLTSGESSTSKFVSYPSYNDLKPFHSSFYWLAAGVNYTGGNHQYSINDTGSNLPLILPVHLVHLDLLESPRIFEKIKTTQMLFSGAWGGVDSWKQP